jgi:hypothetical protein
MKQKAWVTQAPKKDDRVIIVGVDVAHLPSKTHKYGALKNKAQVFDDRRKRKPKYKPTYMED